MPSFVGFDMLLKGLCSLNIACHSGVNHDKGSGNLSRIIIWYSHNRGIPNLRVPKEQVLKFGWGDTETTDLRNNLSANLEYFEAWDPTYLDHLLESVVDCDEAFPIDGPQIARVQISIRVEAFRCLCRIIQISHRYLRPTCPELFLCQYARCLFLRPPVSVIALPRHFDPQLDPSSSPGRRCESQSREQSYPPWSRYSK